MFIYGRCTVFVIHIQSTNVRFMCCLKEFTTQSTMITLLLKVPLCMSLSPKLYSITAVPKSIGLSVLKSVCTYCGGLSKTVEAIIGHSDWWVGEFNRPEQGFTSPIYTILQLFQKCSGIWRPFRPSDGLVGLIGLNMVLPALAFGLMSFEKAGQ